MVYTRPSLKHWVCKDSLPSKSSSVNTGGILEYCVLGPEKGDKCRCREKGLKTLSRWQTKALEIAAFVLHVEYCSWGGCSKSQRTSNDSKPFIFSNENRETRLFPCVAPGEVRAEDIVPDHAACRGRWGVCVLYRKGGPVPASCRVSAFLGFYWMLCSCQLPLPLLASSIITATFLTLLLLLSLLMLSFLSPVVFCLLFLASLLCPNPFEALPSFSVGNNSFPRF